MNKDPLERNPLSDTTTGTFSLREGPLEIHRWGPLQVRETLGHGGFGTVYRAWDPNLQREVALKLLDTSRKDLLRSRETILREGRLLARIRHQNVATVHGVAEHDGMVGLWMELVRGKSLEQLLKTNGPFGSRESIGIGIEVCSALGAAHTAGVVHGDISAKNVIREEGGRIVLVDLGLGTLRPEVVTHETPWAIAGTPVYMAPEMLQGRNPSVTTDVYAMGVLLYHLVAGEYPSEGAARLNEARCGKGDLLRDLRPGLSEAFCRVVERALAPNPGERFQSMGEFQVALERCSQPLVTTNGYHRRNRFFSIGIALALIAALLIGAYLVLSSHPQLPEGSKIMLADLDNKTQDVQLDGVSALLRSQLSQLSYFDLLDQSVIKEVLQRMARPPDARLTQQLAREVAWREGIDLVVAGELTPLGNSYLLNVNVEKIGEDPDLPETIWTNSFRASDKSAIFDVIDETAAWIRDVIARTSTDGGPKTLPSREATTASWEALDSYSRAEELQEKGHSEDAVLLLQEAVRIDPSFALAHMRTGDILISLGRHREGYKAWQRALHTARSRRLTRREELRIAGLYAYDTNDFKESEKIFQTFSLQYPNDYHPFFLHAFALRAQGRYEEAIHDFEQAGRRRSLFHIPAQLARTWMLMGKLDLALQQAGQLREMNQPEWALVMEASCRFLEGRLDQAEAKFRQLIASPDSTWKSEGYGSLAYMLGEQGRTAEAMQLLEQGILHDSRSQMASRKADKLIAKAYLAYQLGDAASCKRACLEAVDLEAGPLRLARAGSLLARVGAVAEAEQLLKRFGTDMHAPVFRLARSRICGEIFLRRKLYPQAIASLREAEQLEPFYSPKEYLASALAKSGRSAEALDQYLIIKKSPARFWQAPQAELPGIWADSLLRCAELAESLHHTAVAQEARDAYRRLRPTLARQPIRK
ncbi:MAG: protein kinase [Acidobacteriota bacterium]